MKKFKIVIPSISIDKKLIYCLRRCLELDHNNFIIIIIIEKKDKLNLLNSFLKNNRNVNIYIKDFKNMSAKRNFAVFNSEKVDFIAFIDSDAYPSQNWLKEAEYIFNNSQYKIIGGPSAIPFPNNSFQKKITNYAKKSFFLTGEMSNQKIAKKSFETNNIESCNMFVRESIYRDINGMNEKLYQAEDFSLCKMVKENNKKNIIYFSKDLIVYHMDRDFKKFLLQRFTFGMNHVNTIKNIQINKFTLFLSFVPLIYILFVIIHLLFIERTIHLVFFNILIVLCLTFLVRKDYKLKQIELSNYDLFYSTLVIIMSLTAFSLGIIISIIYPKKNIQRDLYKKSQN